MLLVYVPKSTSRLRYTMRLMLGELLGLEYNITANIDEFNAYSGPKFTYGKTLEGNHLHFASFGLLFETGIGTPMIQVIESQGIKALFPVFERNSALPYDPFSAAFFMVTRYEEYMPYRKDQYGRFTAMESIAHKHGFLQKPVVNHWARQLGEALQKRYTDLVIKQNKYHFVPTYDIDQAWSYKGKGFVRTTGAFLKAALAWNFSDVAKRMRVITGTEPDPFDTYDYQLELQRRFHLRPIYFFLFARYGGYDKNISTTNTTFRQLIKRLADYADAGIHPSYASNTENDSLSLEIKELSKVLNKEISLSRQHFLKLHLPETYRNLASYDITTDHTMGFAALPGFRAGICTPYQFYDVDLETVIPVTVVPFAVMDGTLRDYMNLSPEAAIEVIHKLIAEVRSVDGLFVSLWHNDSLSETGRWIGWRHVYEDLVNNAAT
ncbi:MAG: polysaccharide deacetylase family protein [Bacteroidales bacterium]|nr:polysaccharide deacetylase family protein [Bacteroidales bacterium]